MNKEQTNQAEPALNHEGGSRSRSPSCSLVALLKESPEWQTLTATLLCASVLVPLILSILLCRQQASWSSGTSRILDIHHGRQVESAETRTRC